MYGSLPIVQGVLVTLVEVDKILGWRHKVNDPLQAGVLVVMSYLGSYVSICHGGVLEPKVYVDVLEPKVYVDCAPQYLSLSSLIFRSDCELKSLCCNNNFKHLPYVMIVYLHMITAQQLP